MNDNRRTPLANDLAAFFFVGRGPAVSYGRYVKSAAALAKHSN